MKFGLKSVRELAVRAWETFRRFPLVLLVALAAAIAATILVDDGYTGAEETRFVSIILTCALGIPLFFSLRLVAETRRWSTQGLIIAYAVGAIALILYYVALPNDELRQADAVRFFLLEGALHLWVAFAPFVGLSSHENGFWQYNRVLFLRFATAALFSAVLFVGLSLAIAAIDALLGVDVDEKRYFQLWLFIVFVYNTWFFLAGIPHDVKLLDEVVDYPIGLKIFTQYVLIPLVFVYLVILYIYMGKILIQWDLPKGWVGYPVIGVSVAGMLTLLLMHPIRARAENEWVNAYGKFFYLILFPLIGLIAVAIGTRVGDYGITEKRYMVIVLTAWLFAMAMYYTVKSSGSIRVIPISLAALLALSAFGPWGAVGVSRTSQLSRLRNMLVTSEVMENGRLSSNPKTLEFEREKEISNIVQYLHDTHGLNTIRDWYEPAEDLPEQLTPQLAMQRMGLTYISRWEQLPVEGFSLAVNLPAPIRVAGYDVLYSLSNGTGVGGPPPIEVGDDWWIEPLGSRIRVWRGADSADALELDLTSRIGELLERYGRPQDSIPPGEAVVRDESERYRAAVHIEHVTGKGQAEDLEITFLQATILLGAK